MILTRQPQKAIHIAHPEGRITVRILDISGDSVRLGIEAPKSVDVIRDDARATTQVPKGNQSFCWKCGAPDFEDNAGFCWTCFRNEQED